MAPQGIKADYTARPMSPRLILLLALSLSTTVQAQSDVEDLRDIHSARSYAMGGAYRALGLGTESVLGNPAAIAMFKMYRMELHGSWDTHGKDAFGGLSVMDAKTSDLAAGLDYHLLSLRSGAGRTTAHFTTLALAFPLTPGVLIGSSVHYLRARGGPFDANATTVDAGLLLRFSEGFTIGFSGHNLIDTRNPELTRYYSAHAGFLAGLLVLGADVRADFQTREESVFTYGFGAEYILGQSIPVRLGYTYDGFNEASQLGVGLGFMTQEGGGIDIGYRHDFGGEKGRVLALSIKMQVG
jgi:opacity protein-like surface antigen